jgi:hypothetical protein
LQLDQMRSLDFFSRFVDSVAATFSLTRKVARFGDQDFINAFYRLHPDDVGLLPCGCNYQIRGSLREEICEAKPIHIIHAW